ncbi:MAG: tetratricopeptide repeat protein [Magnetococcales bacterium]|nr:tetratricopeptide repeat protein [Magnetococcales bacterium]
MIRAITPSNEVLTLLATSLRQAERQQDRLIQGLDRLREMTEIDLLEVSRMPGAQGLAALAVVPEEERELLIAEAANSPEQANRWSALLPHLGGPDQPVAWLLGQVYPHSAALGRNSLLTKDDQAPDPETAIQSQLETIRLLRSSVKILPDIVLPHLATALNNLGVQLDQLGRREEALAATEEAIGIRRTLVHDQSNSTLPELAGSLHNLSITLRNLGRYHEALQAAREAVEIQRNEPSPQAKHKLTLLSIYYLSLALNYKLVGKMDEALHSLAESITTLHPLLAKHPENIVALAHSAVTNYLSLCQESGQDPDPVLLDPILAILQKNQITSPQEPATLPKPGLPEY